MTDTVLEVPAPTEALPHDQDLPREVLACLFARELVRFAAILDDVPDLEEAEAILIPAGAVYRVLALGTAALKSLTAARPSVRPRK
jgi:hypothetical protein